LIVTRSLSPFTKTENLGLAKCLTAYLLSTVNNIMFIHTLMLKTSTKAPLKVSMDFGGSAFTFAASHKDWGNESIQQHTAVDPTQSAPLKIF
jgi:hypothetical protein